MRVSLSWIKRLLDAPDLGISDAALSAKLALSVAEIEALERTGPNLTGVVVGRVLTCAQHPNADRLRVTTVDVGGPAPLPIVCGAPYVAAGQLVAVATVGATLSMPGKDGKPATVTIKSARLRGEQSEGMICAEDELGLGSGHDGILVLTGEHAPGTPLATVVGAGDSVLVIENHAVTHRPDLWGHLGWAREAAAATAKPTPAPPDISWQARGDGAWSVELRDDGCTAYYGAVLEGVRNDPSPQWLQDHLKAIGIRPLGLLVDVTNYVMMELGEPMHAFDLRDLAGKKIVVRAAADGDSFTTLDGTARKLAGGDLLICDGDKPVALAGIMGGAGSMIREDTTAVLLEAAIFRPERIRRTRQRTGLATDSSARFEKGLYPELAPAAINRAVFLIDSLIKSCRVTHRFNAGAGAGETRTIKLDTGHAKRLLGIEIDPTIQRGILGRLGFNVQGDQVVVPWWRRKDVHGAADLVEEIGRHHGYDKIAPAVPRLPAEPPARNALRAAEHRARRALSAQGWDEVQTYAFTSEAWAKRLQFDDAKLIRLEHPLSSEQTVMRPSLVPTLAEAIARNRKHLDAARIYEIGKRYRIGIGRPGNGCEDEALVVAGACAASGDAAPFYAARDAALALLRGLDHSRAIEAREYDSLDPYLAPGRVLALHAAPDRRLVGFCGELDAETRALAGCPERVGYFELFLEDWVAAFDEPKPIRFAAPSRFPRVEREYTWVCPEPIAYCDLEAATRAAAGETCAGVTLITIYRGDPIPAGQKAVSLRVALQSPNRTLDEPELNRLNEAIVERVTRETAAVLRA